MLLRPWTSRLRPGRDLCAQFSAQHGPGRLWAPLKRTAFQPESKPSPRGATLTSIPRDGQAQTRETAATSRHEPHGAPRPRAARPLCAGLRAVPLTAPGCRWLLDSRATAVPLTRGSRSGTHCLLDAGLHLLAQQAFEDEGVAELLGLREKGQDPGGLWSRVPHVPCLWSSTLRSRLTSQGKQKWPEAPGFLPAGDCHSETIPSGSAADANAAGETGFGKVTAPGDESQPRVFQMVYDILAPFHVDFTINPCPCSSQIQLRALTCSLLMP